MSKKSAKSKGFRKQNVKKPYLSKKDVAILCVIVALLAVAAFFLFRYDDGALKVQDGAVVTDGDNWLIADGSNVRGRARYFKLGEIGEIDGYSREKGAVAGDANLPEYAFRPAEEGGGDTSITVTCGHAGAEAMAKYSLSTLVGVQITTAGDIQSAEMAGQAVQYYTYATDYTAQDGGAAAEATEAPSEEAEAPAEATEAPSEEAEAPAEATETPAEEIEAAAEADSGADTRYSRSVAGYLDASHDCCVIINVVSRGATDDDCLPDEALTAVLEKAVAAIQLDTEK